jgi:ABC-type phosphate transport system permease subunit
MVNGLFGMSLMIKICITPFECISASVTHLCVIMPCLLKEMEWSVHTW